MLPSEYNEYPCPACEEDVRVPLPASAYVTCPSCQSKLEIHPDAEFFDEHWHDRTTLSIVDEEREHMKKMLNHLQQHGD
jgi:DNA-directed RNA polymerase subunit RPC12/RpoP